MPLFSEIYLTPTCVTGYVPLLNDKISFKIYPMRGGIEPASYTLTHDTRATRGLDGGVASRSAAAYVYTRDLFRRCQYGASMLPTFIVRWVLPEFFFFGNTISQQLA